MTRQEEFLWIVQTMILANVAHDNEASTDGAFVAMAEAVRVSSDLPDNLTIADAAHDFCTYMLPNLHDEDETPDWLQSLQTRRTAAGRA